MGRRPVTDVGASGIEGLVGGEVVARKGAFAAVFGHLGKKRQSWRAGGEGTLLAGRKTT